MRRRGFCAPWGTTRAYDAQDGLALCVIAFDEPDKVAPVIAYGIEGKRPWCDEVPNLPRRVTLLGHMVHVERAWIGERGTLGLGRRALAENGDYLASPEGGRRYRQMAFIFHDQMLGSDMIVPKKDELMFVALNEARAMFNGG